MMATMTPWLVAMATGALALGCAASAKRRPLETGQAAPEFEARAHDGSTVSLAGLTADGPLVLSLLRGFM